MSGSGLQKFSAALLDLGLECRVITLPGTTRSARDAASAIGCEQSRIVKSIIFKTLSSNTPVLALVSGSNTVCMEKLGQIHGEALGKADADFVRNATGYAIGGVPPLGHGRMIDTYLDDDLFAHATVWAAAGDAHSVFEIETGKLLAATLGTQAAIKNLSQ
ncbi:MAG: YbaK/EbsC family protein [Proteobacteria bacterium]|nr:YbaK/EbsC family protein [Pseudomonadota bacterium]